MANMALAMSIRRVRAEAGVRRVQVLVGLQAGRVGQEAGRVREGVAVAAALLEHQLGPRGELQLCEGVHGSCGRLEVGVRRAHLLHDLLRRHGRGVGQRGDRVGGPGAARQAARLQHLVAQQEECVVGQGSPVTDCCGEKGQGLHMQTPQ